MTKPIIITGCGRSGTHWLSNVLRRVLGSRAVQFEPGDYRMASEICVDSRLRFHANELAERGHHLIHLVRDGRDVVRSLDQWYRSHRWARRTYSDGSVKLYGDVDHIPFPELCLEWKQAVDIMRHHKTIRLEDLSSKKAKDSQSKYALPHWREWDEEMTDAFWDICGKQMEWMGYERDS